MCYHPPQLAMDSLAGGGGGEATHVPLEEEEGVEAIKSQHLSPLGNKEAAAVPFISRQR